jgi:hypothetical protein
MNKNINKIIALLGVVTITVSSVNAVVTTIPDWTAPKAGLALSEESTQTLFPQVSTGSLYISGRMDFTTVDTDDIAFSYFLLRGGTGLRQLIGINSEGPNFEIRTYDGPTNHPLNGLTTAPTDGASVDFIFKIDLTNLTAAFWLSPDRSKAENDQASAVVTTTFNPLHFGPIDNIKFATGKGTGTLASNIGVTAFSNFKVYSGNDNPFNAVPEPETYALIFGGLSLGFVLLRRRMKA